MDSPLSILIVEDDFSFALELEMLVEDLGYEVAAILDNAVEALELIYNNPPDLILMDIKIKGKISGIEIAENIAHLNIPTLFITSFNQPTHAVRAKNTNSFIGYMVKPIDKKKLVSHIELAMRTIGLAKLKEDKTIISYPFKENLFFKKNGIYKKINIQDICYITADGNTTYTKTADELYSLSYPLNELEVILMPHAFMRIHRSYLVNLKKIDYLDTNQNQIIIGKEQLPISRTKKRLLVAAIRLLQ